MAGISKDELEPVKDFALSNDIEFPLMADEDGEVCQEYDVMNFFGFVKRSTYILDGRKIMKTYPKVHVDGHVEKIIDFLSGLDEN
ncbi:AhpC/TSA family protein [Halarsenatibacter silvermanii]|uniref:AhpC/TSA family protein n=1 Tax=Halarsenatibacter silvermanii TaxID=321763 RepID=A0A1G9KI69_9FIRM|nr:AhpC/TSA family protein [Halarsenatibacter silvermanii]